MEALCTIKKQKQKTSITFIIPRNGNKTRKKSNGLLLQLYQSCVLVF